MFISPIQYSNANQQSPLTIMWGKTMESDALKKK
jgi:hypothetical protein